MFLNTLGRNTRGLNSHCRKILNEKPEVALQLFLKAS